MELHTLTGNAILEISIVACICLILAVVILLGKGDWLIAGYNTASKEDKEKCIMPRLRGVIAAILVCAAVFVMLLLLVPALSTIWTVAFISLVVVGLILANTWAKKK